MEWKGIMQPGGNSVFIKIFHQCITRPLLSFVWTYGGTRLDNKKMIHVLGIRHFTRKQNVLKS